MIKFVIDDRTFAQISNLIAKLQIAAAELDDRSEAHRRIKDELVRKWTRNFDDGGGAYGSWSGLRPFTMWFHSISNPKATLNRTGTLRAGFLSQAGAGDVTHDSTAWTFRKDPEYLYVHQFGNPDNTLPPPWQNTPAPIPARPMWGLNEDDEEMAHQRMNEYVEDVLLRHFN